MPKPLWDGPTSYEEYGGVSQSLLGKFFACKERFRLNVIEGWKERPQYEHRVEFGNAWHVAEEAFAASPKTNRWEYDLKAHCLQLAQDHPGEHKVSELFEVIRRQFPLYIAHWKKHPDVKERTPLFQEQVFDVPYQLPSGRVVRLRGKFDSVDIIGRAKAMGLYVQENKAKGDPVEAQIVNQISFDLQSMMYTLVMRLLVERGEVPKAAKGLVVRGVRYNVVRRPLAGGKNSIVRRKGRGKAKTGAETATQFYDRLAGIMKAEPKFFFMRYKVDITTGDHNAFHHTCFNPVLENLCDWYEWQAACYTEGHDRYDYIKRAKLFPHHQDRHYRMPFGIYNPVWEGRVHPLDELIQNGDRSGVVRTKEMFTELATAI